MSWVIQFDNSRLSLESICLRLDLALTSHASSNTTSPSLSSTSNSGTALLGGLSAPVLFIAFSLGASFELLLLIVVTVVGTLVGIELPLLMRILENRLPFKELVSRSLTYDYAGALLGSARILTLPRTKTRPRSNFYRLRTSSTQPSDYCRHSYFETTTKSLNHYFRNARITSLFVIAIMLAATFTAPRLVGV